MLSLMCVCYTLLLRSSSALSSQFLFNCLVFSSRLILSFFSPNKNWYHCSFPSLLLPLAVPALSVVNALKKKKKEESFFSFRVFCTSTPSFLSLALLYCFCPQTLETILSNKSHIVSLPPLWYPQPSAISFSFSFSLSVSSLQSRCCQNILLYFDDSSQWPAVYKRPEKVRHRHPRHHVLDKLLSKESAAPFAYSHVIAGANFHI